MGLLEAGYGKAGGLLGEPDAVAHLTDLQSFDRRQSVLVDRNSPFLKHLSLAGIRPLKRFSCNETKSLQASRGQIHGAFGFRGFRCECDCHLPLVRGIDNVFCLPE